MTDSLAISVIMPTLNAGDTVDNALASLVVAFEIDTKRKLELIVIDGGSHDDTLDKVNGYRDRLSSMKIQRQTSHGLAAARNEGLLAATSPLIGFCDADDAWTPEAVKLRCSELDRQPNAWGITGHVSFRPLITNAATAPPARRTNLSTHIGYTPGAFLVRRSLFDNKSIGTFDETLRIGADSDWILRAIQTLGPPAILPDILLEKGVRAGSLSTDVATYREEMQIIARRFIQRVRRANHR